MRCIVMNPSNPNLSPYKNHITTRHVIDTKVYSDNEIKKMFYKMFVYLGNVSRDFDYCFIGGAFVFEDAYGHLFNLLTYNKMNLSVNECEDIEMLKMSPHVKMIQTYTHGAFAKNGQPAPCTRNEPLAKIPGCILSPFKCNKYERAMSFKNICNKCGVYPEDEPIEPKEVILYYPFVHKRGNTEKRYIYVKFEAHSVFSVGHVTTAKETYLTGKKLLKDNKRFAKRRENAKLSTSLKLKDDVFYVNRVDEGLTTMPAYDYYNQHVRQGAEFFVSEDLLNMFFDIYLNTQPEKDVCTLLNPEKTEPLHKRQSISRSKSQSQTRKKLIRILRKTKKIV